MQTKSLILKIVMSGAALAVLPCTAALAGNSVALPSSAKVLLTPSSMASPQAAARVRSAVAESPDTGSDTGPSGGPDGGPNGGPGGDGNGGPDGGPSGGPPVKG